MVEGSVVGSKLQRGKRKNKPPKFRTIESFDRKTSKCPFCHRQFYSDSCPHSMGDVTRFFEDLRYKRVLAGKS